MTLIKLLPRIVRLALFDSIENAINGISAEDVEGLKILVLARIAGLLKL